ncbi:LOW QUALITY PROTEIN: dynamin-like protein ARC5, partial [Pistacia vera]|uniref:LOW QUALITY PROTEIN: dynamin-like protein ARC5 n=1 Tax=Pistacia vera TaxID=55513 RepID=UPI00126303B6
QAISLREMEDIASLEEKLGRPLSKQERSRIGVSKLRLFLEELLQRRYMDSVPSIIPLLEKEYCSTTRKLSEMSKELSTLDEVKLKEKGRIFHDLFLTKLSLLLKGTVVAPPDKFGETLQDERTNGGTFIGTDGIQLPHKLIPNAGMRLYGGAQYHRAMAEFRFVVGGMKCPPITREEIVNACGVEDIHDGTNYSRTACVIAVAKARDTFEPFLHQLSCSTLDEVKLKEKGRIFHDLFLTKLSLLLKGTVVAPPDKFGETLQDERTNGGTFIGTDGIQLPHKLIPNAGMRLYGGAQYHRAMAEFRFVVGGMKCPPITREEIVNACGVEDIHDGTNYSRTACVIAVAKARDTFEPFLHQLGFRLLHILKRLLPISVYLLQKDGEDLSGHEVFLRRVASAFNNFAESTERSCREKCMEDLVSTTRYVSWSLHNKNRAGLRQFLDSFGGTEQSTVLSNSISVDISQGPSLGSIGNEKHDTKPRTDVKLSHLASGADSSSCVQTTETRLADLLDNTLWNRRLAPSSERIVYALVQHIFHGIREYFLASAELKFNCFLLMPVVDKLPALLREDLESAFEDDLDNVFDITNLRYSLSQRKQDAEIELKRIKRLKEKFRLINKHLSLHQTVSSLLLSPSA